jgi:hypothetical protein
MAAKIFTQAELSQFVPGSNYWTWKDLLFSNTAQQIGLLNYQYSPDQAHVDSMIVLVEKIIEPLTNAFPGKVRITSCYRSQAVNNKIGGSSTSQHLKGQAADLVGINGLSNKQIFDYIVNNLNYDQIIWEKGTPYPNGNPAWVHVSYNNTIATQRKSKLSFDGTKYTPIQGDPSVSNEPITDGPNRSVTNNSKTTDLNGNQTSSDPFDNANLRPTFEQIARNIANAEAGDVDVTWGKRLNPMEDSDWIGLKQYLLYLASRYTPQSLFPFVELIPAIAVDGETDYESDGTPPEDVKENVASKSASTRDAQRLKERTQEKLKFLREPPPGFSKDRFQQGAKAINAATNQADLFNLDPYKEGIESMGQLSESGKQVFKQRGIGVRVYGQLVLNPAAIDGVPSKPGAIGFTSLEVNAGSQADNGLAMINMELVDVQGNKFTDLNSPWSFIYDARPGSIGGDFWFRFGWQIRVPYPDKNNLLSQKFWNHKGWALFDDELGTFRNQLIGQLNPSNPVITLTQSLNIAADEIDNNGNQIRSLFDEGISFNEQNGQVIVSRRALNRNNYVKLALLNPELSVDQAGAIKAKLNFRTTGALLANCPLLYALETKKLIGVVKGRKINLGDLLLAVLKDIDKFEYFTLTDKTEAKKRAIAATANYNAIFRTREFGTLVSVIGPQQGGNRESIHVDSIKIAVSKKLVKQILSGTTESGMTLLRWFRQVLQDNECELLSAATGSGAGINSTWIITTTQKIDEEQQKIQKQKQKDTTLNRATIETFVSEQDVFSFRFQGSLVSSLNFEKSETPNAMSIAADNSLAATVNFDENPEEFTKELTRPVTAVDKKRNLTLIFAQMQNVSIECLCHPWLGPGKKIFVKGTGFFDGEYQILEVTHSLQKHMFTSSIKAARILKQDELPSNPDSKKENKANAAMEGKRTFGTQVQKQADTTPDTPVARSAPSRQKKRFEMSESEFAVPQSFIDRLNKNEVD